MMALLHPVLPRLLAVALGVAALAGGVGYVGILTSRLRAAEAARAAAEQAAAANAAAIQALRAEHDKALVAVRRADRRARRAQQHARTLTEEIDHAPADHDAPVAPVLRDLFGRLRQPAPAE